MSDKEVLAIGADESCRGFDISELLKNLAIQQIDNLNVGKGGSAVFPGISRTTDSYLPSAHICWNERLGRMMMRVTMDVGAVEEIPASHLDDVEALLDLEARSQRLESAWGFGSDFVVCDGSTPFDTASERRRMEAWSLVEDYQNKQEHVDAMENTLERMNNPRTTVTFGDIEHREGTLEQKRRDMMNVVREQADSGC